MIERQIIAQKVKEKQIEEFVLSYLGRMSCSHIKMQRTPLGEKITVLTARPGLIVGKKGANIKYLTHQLKTRFGLENPQLEVEEISTPALDAATVAKNLMNNLQRFGPKRFKALAYRALEDSMRAGASGIEIIIGGRGVPGERAHSWRFSTGYLKKSGDISYSYMDIASEGCNLKSGTVGIKVKILHSDVKLPDDIIFKEAKQTEESKPQEQQKIPIKDAQQAEETHEKNTSP
ncbi:MAG TPA: 30S ribosomal protein S3 [Candidatus Nanoarchaeia archaeon]|nr:30S ribosomal protein S3 [uncultured archaeon]HZX12324.1 30S ribosomal protein S3 [Candidatus Nanoarchaeia archaeon]